MFFIPRHDWSVLWPYTGAYLERLISCRNVDAQSTFLLVDAPVAFNGVRNDKIVFLREGWRKEFLDGQIYVSSVCVLTFQPENSRLHCWISVPEGVSADKVDAWGQEHMDGCRARFFLGYHPWMGCSKVWESSGDRWWPTRAWLRGWLWRGKRCF